MEKTKFKKKIQNKRHPKFNKKPGKPKNGAPRMKQSVQEDEEIKLLQESYKNIPDFREIKSFDHIPLSRNTRKGLAQNKFRVPTEIQKQSIGPALQGQDILGAAQTGSGKTLGKFIHTTRYEIFLL